MPKLVAAMDELEVAPVPLRLSQSVRLAPEHASFRTRASSARTVHGSVVYDLAVVLLPPESSPSSIPSTPRTPVASRRRGRPPGARWCPPRGFPWPLAHSGESPPWLQSPAS